ncbi:GL21672 [Drosophila persimilis]|uniref:GL21672 n=1 Tax=Drosophila persimilis TaxID=7234 RepID=B4GF77_DROPE|nr:GL21672 [Drosophila persimilis]
MENKPHTSRIGIVPKTANKKPAPKSNKGRKRLFDEAATTSTTTTDGSDMEHLTKRVQPPRKARGKENTSMTDANVIDLCSDSESEDSDDLRNFKLEPPTECKTPKTGDIKGNQLSPRIVNEACPSSPMVSIPSELLLGDVSIKENLLSQSSRSTTVAPHESPIPNEPGNPDTSSEKIVSNGRKQRTPKPCPPYKVVEGTHFCVDGFQFGVIPGVTHYFLTHFHADHYIGLTKKFAFPLFMSPLTARLVRAFIKIDEMYIHEIDVDQTILVDNIQITGIEANHCPGALMFFFKMSSGECILHTGDFRASFEMESLPIFWNNIDIDLLYLDTTYLSGNYDFCHQTESVDRAVYMVQKFHERYPGKRILYVCGSYVIGKEKIWLALAEKFSLTVWTEAHRRIAIDCLEWPDLQSRLNDDPYQANLHVIGMGKVTYLVLAEYFKQFEDQYDMLLAIRPSGWEKNSKPSYGKRISIIGIEYSEHSSYKELERFVRFIKPRRIISTVPVGRDLFVTGKVPAKWYQFKGHLSLMTRGYQPSISTFLATPNRKKPPSRTEMALSPVDENKTDWETTVQDHVTISSSNSENSTIIEGIQNKESHGDGSDVPLHKSESPVKSKPSTDEEALLNRLTSDASDDWLADS